jgi:hypothetical protein
MKGNSTLQALDLLIEDFGADSIAAHFQDIFKSHLRNSEGYDAEALADEYEIGLRVIDLLKEREVVVENEKRKRITKNRRKLYEQARESF